MRKIRIFMSFFLILNLFVSYFPAAAQNAYEGDKICYGWYSFDPNNERVVSGLISNNEPSHQWVFAGQAGTFATVRMETADGNLEPFVYVTDPITGQRIGSSSGLNIGGRNIATLSLSLGSTGDYVITATRVGEGNGASAGSYRISLEPGAANPMSVTAIRQDVTERAITNGLIYDGEIARAQLPLASAASEFAAWHFEGQQGQRINTVLRAAVGSSLQGARLELYALVNGKWHLQTSTDATDFVSEARISNFELIASGPYALVVSMVGVMNYGGRLSATHTGSGRFDRWAFYGNSGDTITISYNSTAVPSVYMPLLNATGDRIDFMNSTSGAGGVQNRSLDSNGMYYVDVRNDSSAGGQYNLTLTNNTGTFRPIEYEISLSGAGGTRPPLPECQEVIPTCDTASPLGIAAIPITSTNLSGSVSGATPIVPYVFPAFEGSAVSLTMQRSGGDLDTFVVLADQNGNVINRAPGLDPSVAAINNYRIPATGCYFVFATREGAGDGTTEGTYTLSVAGIEIDGDSCDVPSGIRLGGDLNASGGVEDESISGGDWRVAFRLQTSEAGVLTAQARRNSGDLTPAIALLDGAGAQISYASGNILGDASNPLSINAEPEGCYFIVVQREDGETGSTSGDFTLTLTAGGS
jgi:hypothetical protein